MAIAIIKRWSMKHEAVVQMYLAGWPRDDIANHVGYTEIRVSQILADPKAKIIIEDTIRRLRLRLEEEREGKIISLSKEAIDRIAETIEHKDFVIGSDEKKHQDRLSLDFLRGAGILNGEKSEERSNKSTLPLDRELSARVVDALEQANKAEELRRKALEEVVEAEVEEVEEEVIESPFELVES